MIATTPQATALLSKLFTAPETPYGSFPFDQFFDLSSATAIEQTMKTFRTAMQEAITLHRAEIDAITAQSEPATFDNTIRRFEESGEALEAVTAAFYNLLSAYSCPEMMQLSETFSDWLSKLSTDTLLNEALFARIRSVYDQREELHLDEIDLRLLTESYEGFADNGALLVGAERERFREINEQLSQLTTRFAQNKLCDEESWTLFVPADESDRLRGLPQQILDDAQEKARTASETHSEGYLFDLSAPHVGAIMKHCADRELRYKMYLGRGSVGNRDNEQNNRQIVRQIATLRGELARLLGHPNYATYRLKHRMCNTPEQVEQLLDDLTKYYRQTALDELDELDREAGFELESWDLSYYMERHSEQTFGVKEEELRPYFPLSKVISGVFAIATRLYGITFAPAEDVAVYHPDVRPYQVLDSDGAHLGLLYLDFFPRKGKRSGAWMNNLREWTPTQRPHILLVMNFTPPTAGKEAMLTLSEVHTLLHEFGHSLHGLLTQTRYSSMSGTNVERDFVELPSQFMENYLLQPDVVTELLSKHYQTGEPLPAKLLNKAIQATQYPVGYSTIRQVIFGKLDMAYHTLAEGESLPDDLYTYERETLRGTTLRDKERDPEHPKHIIATAFSHIFAGGYAAGYYGYKWSEMLATDAFERFSEEGIFSPTVATDFRHQILERGDELDPMELYVRFRGRKPTLAAMLKRDGITPQEEVSAN